MNDNARSPGTHQSLPQKLLSRKPDRETAFTQIELLAVCAALLLVALVVAPAAVSSKSDSERLVCFNNLRLMGRGVQIWAGEHNRSFSWRTLTSEGGTMPDSGTKPGASWFEYVYLSNELVTPKILCCPSDAGVLRARSWAELVNVPFRGNAISYPINLDGSTDASRSWLSADHNFTAGGPSANCSARVNSAIAIPTFGGSVFWTNAVHGEFGHILTTDGAVEFASSERLTDILVKPLVDDNGQTHFLKAR